MRSGNHLFVLIIAWQFVFSMGSTSAACRVAFRNKLPSAAFRNKLPHAISHHERGVDGWDDVVMTQTTWIVTLVEMN
jgi:hypothetical protein